MSPPDRKKFCWGIVHATGRKGFTDPKTEIWLKQINRKIRIPIDLYPCQVEEKLTMKEVDGEMIMKLETKMIAKDGTVSKFPGKVPGYTPSKEEEEEPEKKGSKKLLKKGQNMRRSQDSIVVHEMFNGGVKILSLYMRCSTDELRWRFEGAWIRGREEDSILTHRIAKAILFKIPQIELALSTVEGYPGYGVKQGENVVNVVVQDGSNFYRVFDMEGMCSMKEMWLMQCFAVVCPVPVCKCLSNSP
ncbi:hypothetical protein Tco_0859281 [Tanacetum coccineum]|uniref:Uncharacterized protein n=1 Tax=Tanacetum coccineum TaxID=301880 RepID=A0ABQ5BFG8_9ASTR